MADSPFSLEGQVVLVSGAGRGMGRDGARLVAGSGATVALTARTHRQVEEAAESIRAEGGTALAFVADVSDIEGHEALLDTVEARCGELTGLVNFAGVSPNLERAERLNPEQFDEIFAVNQRGTFFLTQAVAKRWIARGVGGSVVTVSSVASRFGLPRNAAYAMSRGAVEAMTKSMAGEWGHALPHPIRVNCVSPGFIDTQFIGDLPSWYVEKTQQHTALRRWGRADEVAGAVVYLLSEAASFVTGSVLEVSGGYGIWSLDPPPKK